MREVAGHLAAILWHSAVPILRARRWDQENSLSQATFSPPETPPASLQMELTLGWERWGILGKLLQSKPLTFQLVNRKLISFLPALSVQETAPCGLSGEPLGGRFLSIDEVSPKNMLWVLIVGEHLLVRQGLKQIFSEEFRDVTIGEAKSPAEVVLHAHKQAWDLVIFDLGMRLGAISTLQEIASRQPRAKIIVLGPDPKRDLAGRVGQLGASAYVSLSAGRAELVRVFKNVLGGKPHSDGFPPAEPAEQIVPSAPQLSAREHSVMLALASGKRNSEIADELGLSVKTVSTYRRRLLDKLNLATTADIVRYVMDNRLS